MASNKAPVQTRSTDRYVFSKLSKDTWTQWYCLLSLGRMLDERAPNYLKQAIGWSYHAPYAGHDAIQLAIGLTFERATDHLFPYYRDMLTAIAAGLSAEEIILNGISKATDLASGGRHMSNHFAKPEWNIHNVSSCTGNHTLHAVGVARAFKYYDHRGVVISSQGESSVSEGYCYEAINGASREILPVIFVFQDNGYGISVPKHEQTANERISDNFTGFKNLKIIQVDGLDIIASMNAMHEAKQHCLKGLGPVIVDAKVVRIGAHSNSDKHEWYRDEKELSEVKSKDPFINLRKKLIAEKIFTQKELDDLDAKSKEEVKKAHTLAMQAPDPDPASIYDFVVPDPYIDSQYQDGLPPENLSGEPVTMITALNETLKEMFRENEDTFIWGQDMANKEKGGIFNVSKGMQQEFGPKRVFNAPIAEDFIVGTANGMSRFNDKIRIVVEGAEFADYFWPAMEQLVETSHDYWRSNGKFSPNIVIRLASGGYIGGGLYHSQNIEGALCTFPGIRVVCPAFADDAAGLLRTAMRSRGTTLYLEPKAQYNAKTSLAIVPENFCVPFGKSRVRRIGTHLSVFCYGNAVHLCLEAAEMLAKDGYSLEVVDLRSLNPLDEQGILTSLKKTNRAIVVHEDKVFAGFGGEVVAFIQENGFKYLDAPVKRIGSTFTPVGFNRILERAILPDVQRVLEGCKKVLTF